MEDQVLFITFLLFLRIALNHKSTSVSLKHIWSMNGGALTSQLIVDAAIYLCRRHLSAYVHDFM